MTLAVLLLVRVWSTIPSRAQAQAVAAASQPKSLKTIALDTLRAFQDDRTLAVSAGATFYGLLALFPAIASVVSIYGLFADTSHMSEEIGSVSDLLPGGAVDIIREQIARIASKGGTALGAAFLIGLLTSLWSAGAGVKAMFDALNVAYGLKERRSFLALNVVALAFTLGLLATTMLAAALLLLAPPLFEAWLGGWTATIVAVARWPVLLVFLSLTIALLYYYGPTPQERRWRWLSPGSLFAAVLWCVVSSAFSFYASRFGNYNATYGSLGAAIGLMTWMWLSITVILLGAELNAQIDRTADAKRSAPN